MIVFCLFVMPVKHGKIIRSEVYMTEKQSKIIEKLNQDNKSLSDAHKSWVEYSKGRIILGIGCAIVLMIGILLTI